MSGFGLTPREEAVLLARMGGERHKEIAARLGISASTSAVHQYRAMRKLGVTSLRGASQKWRAELVTNIEGL